MSVGDLAHFMHCIGLINRMISNFPRW